MYAIKRLTEPASEPVTVDEVKLSQRVDHDADDDMIESMILAARERCEGITGRAIAETEWALTLDAWPAGGGCVYLPRPPLVSVDEIVYYDLKGTAQTMTADDFRLMDATDEMACIAPVSEVWPVTEKRPDAVRITYTSGHDVCPESLRRWIILAAGDMYANREASSDRPAQPQGFADGLLDRWRVYGEPV